MIDCNVIADLIPLYIDDTCSRESAELVEEHVKTCGDCSKLMERMRAEGIEPKKRAPLFESSRLIKSVRKSFLTVMLSLSVMLTCYCFHYFGFNYINYSPFFSLVFTVMYIAAWIVLTVYVKEIIPLIIVNLSFSSITFLYAAFRLILRILYLTDIITVGQYVKVVSDDIALAPIAYLISIPFWGVTTLTKSWEIRTCISAIVSLIVIIYSIISLKNWKKYRS